MPSLPAEIQGVVIRPLDRHVDERGWLAETFRGDELEDGLMPAMSYVSLTKPGVSRGPHEHAEQTDYMVFPGPGTLEVRLWDNRPDSPTHGARRKLTVGEREPVVVVIPPGVVHGYRNVGDREALVVNYPNRLYGGEGRRGPVDEIRHEAEPDSPFKMPA